MLDGVAESEKSTAVPINETVCGLPAAPSTIVSAPSNMPPACGANVREMVQVAAPANDAGQLLVCANGAFAEIPLMIRFAPPVFVKLTTIGALVVPATREPKFRLEVLSETAAGVMPVPLRDALWGLPFAVSVI